jgi:hypothetical protein
MLSNRSTGEYGVEINNNSQITTSGIGESHPHNVTITKEAPNYSR